MVLVDVVNLIVWNQLRSIVPPGTRLTSVKRPASAQLQFIVGKSKSLGYVFSEPPVLQREATWRGALDFLRSKGIKVAAPGRSNHQQGIAYDLSGTNLDRIAESVRKAAESGRITLANSPSRLLIERANNCVHVEITAAIIHNDQFVNYHHTV
jgi:hypothetical protein